MGCWHPRQHLNCYANCPSQNNGSIFIHKTKWNSESYCNMNESWKHYAKWNKPDAKDKCYMIACPWKYLRQANSTGKSRELPRATSSREWRVTAQWLLAVMTVLCKWNREGVQHTDAINAPDLETKMVKMVHYIHTFTYKGIKTFMEKENVSYGGKKKHRLQKPLAPHWTSFHFILHEFSEDSPHNQTHTTIMKEFQTAAASFPALCLNYQYLTPDK